MRRSSPVTAAGPQRIRTVFPILSGRQQVAGTPRVRGENVAQRRGASSRSVAPPLIVLFPAAPTPRRASGDQAEQAPGGEAGGLGRHRRWTGAVKLSVNAFDVERLIGTTKAIENERDALHAGRAEHRHRAGIIRGGTAARECAGIV